MRPGIKFNMAVTLAFLLAVILMFSTSLYSQDDLKREVLVMFTPGTIEFPERNSETPLPEIQFTNELALSALQNFNISSLGKAFPDFSLSDTLRILKTGERFKSTNLSNIYVLRAKSITDVQPLVETLKSLDCVVFAEPNWTGIKACIIPNDPLFGEQWGLENYYPNNESDIDAPEAWDKTTGSASNKIAILDNGVDANHEDLYGKVSGDPGLHEGTAGFPFGHGTNVAGIAAAIGNNEIGIAGVDWHTQIESQRCESGAATDIYDAAMSALNAGCRILNCSFGGYGYNTTVRLAFVNSYKFNSITVASMGNDGSGSPHYPSAHGQGIIAVGASDLDDHPYVWSNHGPWIDVVAPGMYIKTTHPNNDYISQLGTSMSAPFVSGTISLLLSIEPTLCNDDIENIIKIGAKHYPDWDEYKGYGRINADSSLQLLLSPYKLTRSTANASGITSTLIKEDRPGPFLGVDGLVDNMYRADIYEVTRTAPYDKLYAITPYAWGRGNSTVGFSFENPQFGLGYCRVTDVTKSTCKLTTYVYYVYTYVNKSPIGWFPCEPGQVFYAYSSLGMEDNNHPSATVAHPNGGEYYKTMHVIPITWEVVDDYIPGIRCSVALNFHSGFGNWMVLASDLTVDGEGFGQYNYTIPTGLPHAQDNCRIRVLATDTNQNQGLDISDNDFTIEYLSKPNDEPIPKQGTSPRPDVPKKNFLSVPKPNPFNPQTTITFGIQESARVHLLIYNVNGKVVKKFHINTPMIPGEYSEIWDGKNDAGIQVNSGIYFLRLKVGSFYRTQKLILIR